MRTESRPVFLRIDTFRLMAHSKGDDDRAAEEVQPYWAKDPLTRFTRENPRRSRSHAEGRRGADRRCGRVGRAGAFRRYSDSAAAAQAAWRPVSWQATKIARPERGVTLIREAFHRALQKIAAWC